MGRVRILRGEEEWLGLSVESDHRCPVVLVLDDDAAHLDRLGARVQAAGFETILALTPEDALAAADVADFAILDYYVPGLDESGYVRFVAQLRGRNPSLAGALLTNEIGVKARAAAARAGLSWFSKWELERDFGALVSAVREAVSAADAPDVFGARYSRKERQVAVGGVVVTLRSTAYRMLDLLRSRPFEVVSRDELCECLEQGPLSTYEALRNQVKNLRRELREQGVVVEVETVRGAGYRLVNVRPAEEDELA